MNKRACRSLILATLAAACHGSQRAAVSPEAAAVTEYTIVHGWPALPEGYMLGQVTAVGVDSHGDVFVFHRADRKWAEPFPTVPITASTVVLFDGRTGAVKAEWGAGRFIMPHGLSVDAEDNVWITDVGLHQVFKFTHDGRLQFVLGEAGVAGADSGHFDRPTDTAVMPDGSVYVSDGYRNTRVVKFSAEGRMLFQWGTRGAAPGQFDLPHGIALDRNGRVYVSDRTNARIQVFDSEGRFLAQWKSAALGRPQAVATSGEWAYAVDAGDGPEARPGRARAVALDLDGNIHETFGRFGNYDGQFVLPHDIAVSAEGAVYVADVWGQRVQKFTRGSRP